MLGHLLLCWIVVLASLCVLTASAAETPGPSKAGLVLWVDAADPASAQTDADGRISAWRDLSGKEHHLQPEGDANTRPQLMASGMNGKPVLRFSGAQSLALTQPIREKSGNGTVLVVWQRSAGQSTGDKWQRIISSRLNTAKHDQECPTFA